MRADGFALAELMVSVMILALITVLTAAAVRFSSEAYLIFPAQYTRLKSESILTGENRSYEDDTGMSYPDIHFHENGTVNQARTLSFPRGKHESEIVVELGPGTLISR